MFDKDSLHHAYFIEGDKAVIIADLESFLKKAFGILRQANPDVHYSEHESFGIDEARELQSAQSMMPVLGNKKIFIIATDAITSEAQNALLKVFEEPTAGTHFFIISSNRRMLLPTLASRLHILSHQSAKPSSVEGGAEKFISLSPKDRLAFVAGMIEEKDKQAAEGFLLDLVSFLEKDLKGKPKHARTIKELLSLAKYAKDRSPSLKLILERAALLDL